MQSEATELSEINAVTPERPASDVVRLVVHARSATLGDAVDSELRLRCSTGSGAAETAAQVCSAACTVVWNELLVLEAPRDAELTISVLGDGERSSSIDVNQLKPFKSYTLDLPLEGPGGWAAHVTVAAHDDASARCLLTQTRARPGPDEGADGDGYCGCSVSPTACSLKVVRGTAAGAALVPRNTTAARRRLRR